MAIVVNSNTTAMDALGHLNRTNRGLNLFARVSSVCIVQVTANSNGWYAFRLHEFEPVRALTHDGISVVQTAEGTVMRSPIF